MYLPLVVGGCPGVESENAPMWERGWIDVCVVPLDWSSGTTRQTRTRALGNDCVNLGWDGLTGVVREQKKKNGPTTIGNRVRARSLCV